MLWQKSIDHVMHNIDFAVRVPPSKRRVPVVQDSLGEGVPFNLLGLLLPKLLSKLRIGCSPELLLVRVLHQIKICIVSFYKPR